MSLPTYSASSPLVTHAQSVCRARISYSRHRGAPCRGAAQALRTCEDTAACRPRTAAQVAGAHKEHSLLRRCQVCCWRVAQKMHVQASRRLRKGALCNLVAARASAHECRGTRIFAWRCTTMVPRLPNGFARAVRRLRELPLPTRLAHDEIHAVLRLTLGRPAKHVPRISAARSLPEEQSARVHA
jgi:hypothetical protein